MRNSNLIAVVNDDLLMVHKSMLLCSATEECRDLFQEEFHSDIEKIAGAITERVMNDQRFVNAVGEKVAKKVRFDVMPICYECEDCGQMEFIMRVVMTVGNRETDFLYDYSLVMGVFNEEPKNAPYVLYNNDGKSQLMQVFEATCSGVTSVKTFKNGRGVEGSDDHLERIFAEILSEADLMVF